MGSDEDPKDGGAVAGAVFGAVFIYIVRPITLRSYELALTRAGFLRLLWIPSLPSHAREPSRRDKPAMIEPILRTLQHQKNRTRRTEDHDRSFRGSVCTEAVRSRR